MPSARRHSVSMYWAGTLGAPTRPGLLPVRPPPPGPWASWWFVHPSAARSEISANRVHTSAIAAAGGLNFARTARVVALSRHIAACDADRKSRSRLSVRRDAHHRRAPAVGLLSCEHPRPTGRHITYVQYSRTRYKLGTRVVCSRRGRPPHQLATRTARAREADDARRGRVNERLRAVRGG